MSIRGWHLAPGLTGALFGIAAWMQPAAAWAACPLQDPDPIGRLGAATVPGLHSAAMPWSLLTDTFCWHPPRDSRAPGPGLRAQAMAASSGTGPVVREIVHRGFTRVAKATTDGSPALAIGLRGSPWPERIVNEGTLEVRATAGLSSASVSLTLAGGDETADTTTVGARAVGIEGGHGDTLVNLGSVSAVATSSIDRFDAEMNLIDLSHGDTSLTVGARAVGIDAAGEAGHGKHAGPGATAILNSGSVSSQASAAAGRVSVELNAVDAATGDSRVAIDAGATGLRGGAGTVRIDNRGVIQTSATATLADVGVTASFLDATVVDDQDETSLPSTVSAGATGIDATRSQHGLSLQHSGTLRAGATASAHSTQVSVTSEGLPDTSWSLPFSQGPAEFGVESLAKAIGIVSGSRADRLTISGGIAASASAMATQESVNVGIAVLDLKLPTLARDLNNAGTSASASVTGVDSGAGDDSVFASGTLSARATAKASATTVAVDIAELSLDLLPGVPSIPFGVSLVVTDTATEAKATSTGITTGSGNDTLLHRGTLGSAASATSGSTSAAASLNLAYGKGDNTLAIDVIAARAVTDASADAVGLDTGSGRDLLRHEGRATVAASADALAVSAILDVAGTLKGKGGAVSGALTDSSARGSATATGLQGGDGDDTLVGSGALDVGAKANVDGVSVSTTIGIVQQGVVAGATLSRSASTAVATATGLDGGTGRDLITQSGPLQVRAESDADAVAVSVTLAGTAKGIEGGAALADAHTTADATAIGIRTGNEPAASAQGHDARRAENGSGCHPCTPPAAVMHSGTMRVEADANADAVGVGAKLGVAKTGVALGAALARTGSTSTSSAIGIQADGRDDLILNSGQIVLRSVADGDAVSVALTVEGTASGLAAGASLADASVVATAGATGIAGAGGDDRITNRGTISSEELKASATAVSVAPSVLIARQGAALGASLADTRTTATVNLRGIDGGDGRDGVFNDGHITLQNAQAQAQAVSVSLQVALAQEGLAAGAALARSNSDARLAAAGLDGGSGDDVLFNQGGITLQQMGARADAVSVSASLSGAKDGVALAVGLADATGSASTSARAIDAGSGNDLVIQRGTLQLSGIAAEAGAAGIAVSLAGVNAGVAAGVTLADTSATARAEAIGVHGGDGQDQLWNQGAITLKQVTADADAISVGVSLTTAVSGGVAGGAALGRARSSATARATGMDGGAGNDLLSNRGRITIDGIDADTDAVGVSAQLGVTSNGVAIGAALVDTAATAAADARGLDGGSGDDRLFNGGAITLRNLRAQADAVSVGVTVNAALSAGVAAGVALTDGSGTATLQARGVAGGDGNDLIVQAGRLRIENSLADAKATGVSVTLNASLAGVAAGAALADTSATARTEVAGLSGDAGNDTLLNTGSVDVSGKAHAGALSLALQISGAVGVAGGATITDASSTAVSSVIGMAGGAGRDSLFNEGSVKAVSTAASESAAISLGVSVGVGGDATLADARSTASASAVGLHDSAGAPAPGCGHAAQAAFNGCQRNGGSHHDTPADPIDNRGAVTAQATASAKGTSVAGNLLGFALGETTNSATASAAGIQTHDSRDLIRNAGSITSTSSAATDGLSVAVTLGGKSFGDASSTATAAGVGIDSGAGNDQIANLAAIGVDARSQARATSVSVGLVGVAQADASTTARASARGIDAGAGDDAVLNLAGVVANAGLPRLRQGDGQCSEAAGGACATASTVSVTLAGYGDANAASTATAEAVGLDGGAGRDRLDNRGAVTAGALARGRAEGVSVAVLGAASADAGSSASARAVGIDGGRDDDGIANTASVRSEAAAESLTRGMSFTVAGRSSTAGSSVTAASAYGLTGGDGRDAIANTGSGRVAVYATTQAGVSASAWTFAGAAAAQATLGAQTAATGIDGGAGADWIDNAGVVGVLTASQLTANGQGRAIFGGAEAGSRIAATTVATGIDGGSGNDVLINRGQTAATARANMLADTASASFAGSTATTEFVTADAVATALAGGEGDDAIGNDGRARAEVGAVARTQGSSSATLAGNTQASGTVAASGVANGIDGGAGRAWVLNRGSIGAIVSAQSWATHGSDSGVFFSDAGVVARSSARLSGAGITLGTGDHGVRNTGTIEVRGSTGAGDWNGNGQAEGTYARAQADGGDFDIFTGDGDAAGSATARATVALDGIVLGSGHSQVRNEGRIDVRGGTDGLKATAEVDPNGGAVTVDGDAAGWATAVVSAATRGIAASGRVTLANLGSIAVGAAPAATSRVDADGGSSGDTDVFVDARVGSRVAGVELGAGNHAVLNSGTITVDHAAAASAEGDANGQGIDGDGRVGFGIALSQRPGYARVDAATAGIDVGGSGAWLRQQGSVALYDGASASVTARADSDFTGNANAFARSEAVSVLNGLRTRGEQGWIDNSGTVSLRAAPVAGSLASGRASGDGSRARGTAIALSQIDTRLRGIGADGADSQVLNSGRVVLAADPSATARGEAESNLDGNSLASATAGVTARGSGIEASGAGAVVEQRGQVDVRIGASAQASTWSRADGALGRTRAVAESVARVDALAIGLRVADARSTLLQSGQVNVSSSASTRSVTDTDAPGLPKGVENNYSLATASAYGLSVGTAQARLLIANTGAIRVAATSTAQAAAEGSTYMHTEELASARAVGITTGAAGDYTVLHSGSIVASSSASSDWNDLGQAAVSQAIGIRTGSGNDTVMQNGRITATQRTLGVAARGTAIGTGAGNDLVMLGDGSVTEGHIDLGSGHDTLSLQGTPVISGSIGGGRAPSSTTPGSLTLQLLGNGRFAGELPGNIAVKLGPGTYSLSTLRTMDRLEVREGTLALDSGYTMAAGSQFVASVRGDGTHGQLHVRGQASLAGRMAVIGGDEAFVDGTRYDVLVADGGIRAGTAFAAIELPAPTPLLSFDAQQLRDRVRITADVQSYTTVAKSAGQRAIARQLDRIVPLASGELRRTLGAMQRLNSDVEFGTAFDSLDPSLHARHSQASLSGPRKHARTLHDRMTTLRFGAMAAPEGTPSRLALAGGDPVASGQGMWKTRFTLQGAQRERHDVDGLALGFDRRLGDNLTAGVSFAHAANEVQPEHTPIGLDREQSRIRSGLAAVYGSYFDRRWHIAGTLATGRNDYESRRSIAIGSIASPAASSHRGTVTATSLETGYLVPAGRGWLDPYLNLQHTQVAEQGFSETGSGTAGLVIAPRRTRELLSTLGVRWSQIFERGNGAFVTPELGIGWLHDFSRAPSVRASFVGAPVAGFTIEGAPVQREGAVVGLGLNYRTTGGMMGSIRYSGELRRGEASHGVVGEFRVEF